MLPFSQSEPHLPRATVPRKNNIGYRKIVGNFHNIRITRDKRSFSVIAGLNPRKSERLTHIKRASLADYLRIWRFVVDRNLLSPLTPEGPLVFICVALSCRDAIATPANRKLFSIIITHDVIRSVMHVKLTFFRQSF